MIRTVVAAAVAAVASLATAVPAQAAHPRTELVLSYRAAAGYAAAVKLGCSPARGGLPDPGKACRTLKRAGGLPSKIKAADTMCVLIYAPVTADISGTWRGRPIAWQQTYGNKCEMTRATGALFAF